MDLDFWQSAATISTREFSKHPSRVLKQSVEESLLVITKYGQPVACIGSVDYWRGLLEQAQAYAMDEARTRGPEIPCTCADDRDKE